MPGKETSGGFSAVDRAADPVAYVQYLGTVSGMEATQVYKRQSFALLDGKPGARLLDVGCGTGDDAWALASMVGEGGLVIGIDSRETMIAEAVRRSKGSDLGLELRVGDVHRLDFPDATFDGCRTDRTLQYVDDPRAALAEMIRVICAGARILGQRAGLGDAGHRRARPGPDSAAAQLLLRPPSQRLDRAPASRPLPSGGTARGGDHADHAGRHRLRGPPRGGLAVGETRAGPPGRRSIGQRSGRLAGAAGGGQPRWTLLSAVTLFVVWGRKA